ncbi:hypothetical protein QA640_42640 [Bradyrhizobium sp. CB82]|uniref:hypothetical protein n=1 Tax=Bradyrhizobium sp. CB82 TaxID=3039159 RepID=UPI0024B1D1D0|nr:hypothetical protein [Bradyrhizobium sp. CB82]WFU40782.1 hypothetical protein QA640_42640 [Bradyrhizobium sp. CB82]
MQSAKVGEALANYSLADTPLAEGQIGEEEARAPAYGSGFYDDQEIWRDLLRLHSHTRLDEGRPGRRTSSPDPNRWDTVSTLYKVAVSEWVARVPGLYWLPGSQRMRTVHPSQIESKSDGWLTYTPRGKSQTVSGGVGTLKLSPSESGYRLATLTASCNASTGVPALISPDVWDHHRLREGSVIVCGATRWRAMPLQWAAQFPIMQQLPRGCLVLDNVENVLDVEDGAPIQAHPFSIMEYWDGPVRLFDFVYATADTRDEGFRADLSRFFEAYRLANDREGNYLTAADIAEPMWDAEFTSPESLRRDQRAQLRLIERRVEDTIRGIDFTEVLVKRLSQAAGLTDLKRISANAGIEWRRWSQGGAIGDEATRLVEYAISSGKQQALLYSLQYEDGL